MENGYVKSGSANIYYEIRGDKSKNILVLLHGNGQSMEYFKNIYPLLESKYCIVLIDSRGHGKSEFGRAELSLGAMAIDLECVIDHLGFSKINILGFGDGANIALLYAIRCPDIVDKMIIVGGNYNFSGYSIFNRIILTIAYFCSKISGVFDAHNRLNKEYFSLIVKEPRLKKSSLKAILADTLVVAATRDLITLSHSKSMANNIANSSIKIVNKDRFWIFKEPEEISQIVENYIK